MGQLLTSQLQRPPEVDPSKPKGLGSMLYRQLESVAPANPVPEASKKAGPGYHSAFLNINRL